MVLQSHYDPWLIALSYCVAVAGSYLALRFARVFGGSGCQAPEQPIRAITPAAVILGVTIFLMHFTGMA
ncbi:MHYT domain-containing protein, partial [Acinetobacter baumannii]